MIFHKRLLTKIKIRNYFVNGSISSWFFRAHDIWIYDPKILISILSELNFELLEIQFKNLFSWLFELGGFYRFIIFLWHKFWMSTELNLEYRIDFATTECNRPAKIETLICTEKTRFSLVALTLLLRLMHWLWKTTKLWYLYNVKFTKI